MRADLTLQALSGQSQTAACFGFAPLSWLQENPISMFAVLKGTAPVLPWCASTSHSPGIPQGPPGHVIDDYIHVDVYAMRPAVLHHVNKL